MDHAAATEALARETARARRVLHWERAAVAFFPLLAAIGAWLAISLLGLPQYAPPLAASLIGVAALCGLAFFAWSRRHAYVAPTHREARDRLAFDSGLERGLFDALEDSPARLDPDAIAFWKRAQAKVRAQTERARAQPLKLRWGEIDPFRLRFIVGAALLVGVLVAGAQTPDRLWQGVFPDPGPLLGDQAYAVEAWVEAASYTGAAPVTLSDRIGARVATPPSSDAVVRLTGPVGAPWLIYSGAKGKERVRFVKAADGAYEARVPLTGAGTLKIVRFHTKARWRITPGEDAAPKAAFKGEVKFDETDHLTFSYAASDDFGVRAMALRVWPTDPPPGLVGAKPHDTPFEAPAGDPDKAEASVRLNLETHPYAGMDVAMAVVAIDAMGQEGVGDSVTLPMPEKIFLQPLAQAAIELRKIILHERRHYAKAKPFLHPRIAGADDDFGLRTDEQDPRITRAPNAIRRAGRMIDALTMAPEDGYFVDLAVFAGFKLARSFLNQAREIEDTNQAAVVLWMTALRAEYGDAASAREALDQAQQMLADAIARGADAEEIERLTKALQQAMQNYVQALIQQAIREGKRQETQEDTQEQQSMRVDLDAMMRELQRRLDEGDKEGAQQMLQQIQQLMQNMEVQLTEGTQGGGEEGQSQSEMQQSMDELSQQMSRQRGLRDETEQRDEQGEQGQSQQDLAQQQQQLGQDLEKTMRDARQAGSQDGGQDLSEAAEAMRRAEQGLKRGDLDGAARAQDEALRAMRRGAERMAQEMDERNGRASGQARDQAERDPLGRETGAGGEGDDTRVPTEVERQRARDIMEELRRRAQDPQRPEAEREYLRRLLDRFSAQER
jgi:hypothetical protein